VGVVSFVLGLAMLLGGAELLVRGAGRLALALRVPVMVVALTVVAFGTSMPEIVVSVTAALEGNPDVALGNVNGSNIANIALVLGTCAVVSPLAVGRELMRREVPVLLGMQTTLLILAWDAEISRIEGVTLLLMGVAYNAWLVRDALAGRAAVDLDEVEDLPTQSDPLTNLALIAAGLALLVGGQMPVNEPIDDFLRRHRRWTIRLSDAHPQLADLPCVLRSFGDDQEKTVLTVGDPAPLRDWVQQHEAQVLAEDAPALEEIFVDFIHSRPAAETALAGEHV